MIITTQILSIMKKIIATLLLLLSFSLNAQTEVTSNRILTYGYPHFQYQKAMKFVGKNWNLEIYSVAGCVVTQQLMDSVALEDKKLWKKMDSIHGRGAKTKFYKEADMLLDNINASEKLLQKNKQVKTVLRKLKKNTTSSRIEFATVSKDYNLYTWIIYRINKNYHSSPYYKVLINLKTKAVRVQAFKKE